MKETIFGIYAEEYIKTLKARRLSSSTAKFTRYVIRALSDYFRLRGFNDVTELETVHFIQYFDILKKRRVGGKRKYTDYTIYGMFRRLKLFLDFLLNKNIVAENRLSYVAMKAPYKKIPSNILTEEEINRLLSVFPPTHIGIRNQMIAMLIYNTGLRVSEVCKLNLHDFDQTDSILYVRNSKGGKNRVVPLNTFIEKTLSAYIYRDRLSAGACSDNYESLFLSKEGLRIHYLSIERAVRKAARLAGIEKRITPHSLRHTFATHMLKNGCSTRYIADILGHEHLSTTEIYTRIFPVDLKEMVDKYHPC